MKPPCIPLALAEAPRTLLEVQLGSLNPLLLRRAPKGDGHSVMVIPGFLADDTYNIPLVRFLNKLGYEAQGWTMGRNFGPNRTPVDTLAKNVEWMAKEHGPVSLVGHSLGGIYARELARRLPDAVRQVISLGSPFGEGREQGSWASRLFNRMNPEDEVALEQRIEREILATAPPVPTTAIYSKGDGVVNWRTAVQDDAHEQTQNIQVIGSHCGLTHNTAVWYLIADRLRFNKKNWELFESPVFNHH